MEKPIVLVIMDGVGKGDGGSGDAVKVANTPTLDWLVANCPHTYLKAHGTAVGLPTDEDMGNSEVGHNALGCGQIYSQGAKLVGESIANGTLYASETWKELIANANSGKAMHFLGLLSDGNVHSNIHHLIALLREAHKEGVKKAYCHILLDGRDVPATSALEYVDMLEKVLAELNTDGCDYAIASGGGRMKITMDRYEANWPMVEAADKYGYTVLITADHGNADQMTETKKGKTSVRTAHSLNPVPFIIYDKDHDWHIKEGHFGLANVAPTIVKMMGLEAPSCWEESMI